MNSRQVCQGLGDTTVIDYLEQLVETGEYEKAVEFGEQLLKDRENSPTTMLAIQCCLLRAHCSLEKPDKALITGEVCVKLALQLRQWDKVGISCLYLGVANIRLRRYEEAVQILSEYVVHLPQYETAAGHEIMAWYNLGMAQTALGDLREAAKALTQAHNRALCQGNERTLHGIRQALIDTRISIGELKSVPRLLAKCARYLRDNPEGFMNQESWLHHLELRARFALLTGRLVRAQLLSLRGLKHARRETEYPTFFHLLLARVCLEANSAVESLGHATAAQVCAKSLLRPDLESQAVEIIDKVTKAFMTAPSELDRYYLASP